MKAKPRKVSLGLSGTPLSGSYPKGAKPHRKGSCNGEMTSGKAKTRNQWGEKKRARGRKRKAPNRKKTLPLGGSIKGEKGKKSLEAPRPRKLPVSREGGVRQMQVMSEAQ